MKIIITKAIGSNLRNIWKQYKANKSKIHKTLVMRTIKSSIGRTMSLNQICVKFGLHCVYFNSDTS
jgi:hypothetical protein